jgi:pimeloyl-ACP methyl ester carboxylesterase
VITWTDDDGLYWFSPHSERALLRQVRKLQAEGRDHRVVAGDIPGAGKSFGKRAAGERSQERR